MSLLTLPKPLQSLFSQFPLHTYPSIPPPSPTAAPPKTPTLLILPPRAPAGDTLLSSDVECLKWQAYLALVATTAGHQTGPRRTRIALRWDVHPDGAVDGRLPNLFLPQGELLPAHLIPAWVAERGLAPPDASADEALEGYANAAALDESRAWVALLEGCVHAALVLRTPAPHPLVALFSPNPAAGSPAGAHPLQTLLTPPPATLTGLTSLLPPYGTRVAPGVVDAKFRDAVGALSDRLGTDKWLLNSASPTPLDALLFAYLHTLLNSPHDALRTEVARRVNLVAWEWRVREIVRGAFSFWAAPTFDGAD
ncbi:hypothetical protein BD779DRAFT_1468831 [Infundibulicybe gibba]|nr:hypothetical protein BD779DRAFT_1468831 [Infundibulicybe gibba]